MTDRRLKRLQITPEFLMRITSGTFTVTANGVPDGAKLVNTFVDEDTQLINLVIEHESYEPVPVGELIPIMIGPTFRTGA